MSQPVASPAPDSTPLPTPPPQGSWFRRKLILPLLDVLKQGLSPEQLALTFAVGIVVGLIPVLGAITTVAALLALRLRLNVAAMQVISHMMTPLQLLLIVPLLRWGARLFGATEKSELTVHSIKQLFANDWRAALQLLWRAELGAISIWLLAGMPLIAILFYALRPMFRKMAAKKLS
ncbi:hypothetical protein GCM10023185_35580 [Hymenobacter saemangeumensis]|uniref:DUF2062 domain-containing protein n=1 Tax=Hymenobacter saemangeumensis TaxID=1084522 RepID=A0ABP8IPJ1_9BACT